MCRKLDKVQADMNLKDTKDHFHSLRDIGHKETENSADDDILCQNSHGNGKTNMCHDKKNTCDDGKGIVSRIRNGPHTKFAEGKNSCHHTTD